MEVPNKATVVPPSGTFEPGGIPETLIPALVPNEKVALVTVVSIFTPGMLVMTKVALKLRKGLCGPFPAMEPLAAE